MHEIMQFWFCEYIDNYVNQERGIYFDIEELPFTLSKNQNELFSNVLCFDNNDYRRKIDCFFDSIGNVEDGHASERIVDLILKSLQEKTI